MIKTVLIFLIITLAILSPLSRGYVLALADSPTQAQLEEELKNIEVEIAQYERQLADTRSQKTTLSNKIAQLKKQQSVLRLKIKATTLQVKKLDAQIVSTTAGIAKNSNKIILLRAEIGELLRQINNQNQNIFIKLASHERLSDFFVEVKNFTRITASLSQLIAETKKLKISLEQMRALYSDQQDDAKNLLSIKLSQSRDLQGQVSEQAEILKETKGLESNYQAILNDSKKRAAEIRSRIYELFNTGKQINFGQATEIAKWASGLSGARPAFLLAVLTQESNLGKNVGTCNRAGDPPEKSWRAIMKPERDQDPFVAITKELGLDADTTPVSCPMRRNGAQIGWGGAMGPAQFIPSTWMGYKDKVSALTGKQASPWDIRDAFLAAAIKLKAGGADGTPDGEWQAAMRYFSGGVNAKYRFYGDNVLALAEKYEKDILEIARQ